MPTIARPESLLLHLDAGQDASYPGSGTTWSDLSGSGYDFTLVGSPTHVAGTAGHFAFDGIDDHAQGNTHASNFAGLNNITIESWGRLPSAGYDTFTFFSSISNYSSYLSGYNIVSAGDTSGTYANEDYSVGLFAGGSQSFASFYRPGTYFLHDDTWHLFTCVGTTSSNAMYFDGSLVSASYNVGNSSSNGSSSTMTGLDRYRIGGRDIAIAANQVSLVDIAIHRFYNVTLTAEDVAQNFAAQRGRFGV